MEATAKQKTQLWIGIIVSLLSVAAIFLLIDPAEIWGALKTADFRLVAISGLLLIIYFVLRAIRWRFLLNDDIPLQQVFHGNNIGTMVTQVLPFRLGDLAVPY